MKYNPTLHKLSNGVTVILDPMDIETASVKVHFKTGSRDEAPHEQGITHFCEHMLCKGTARFPAQRNVDEYLDDNGGIKNALTSFSSLEFYGRIVAENLGALIEVLADQLQNSSFDPKKIEIERGVILDELRRSLDKPSNQLVDFIWNKIFHTTSRALGTEENILSFTRNQMLAFLSRRLSSKNCVIGISGKITNPDAVLQQLEKSFSFLPTHDVPENNAITYAPVVAHNPIPNQRSIQLRIIFPNICNTWPNTFDNRFKNMCVARFKRHMVQELKEVIRRQYGLVYGFNGLTGGNEKFSITGFSTETSPENIAAVVAQTAKNVHKIYTQQTITDDELRRFVSGNRLGNADWLDSSERRCDDLISHYCEYGCLYDFYDTVRMSESIRRDDVIKYSRGYFDGPMSIITQGANFDADLMKIWNENFNDGYVNFMGNLLQQEGR